MIAHLHVAQGNKHDTFTVKKAKEKKYLRNIAARRNYQYNLVNAMENNAVKYAQLLIRLSLCLQGAKYVMLILSIYQSMGLSIQRAILESIFVSLCRLTLLW